MKPLPVTVTAEIQPETVTDGCAWIEILARLVHVPVNCQCHSRPQNGQVGGPEMLCLRVALHGHCYCHCYCHCH